MVATRKLSSKQLRKRIRTLKGWNVRGAHESVQQYKNELKRRRR